jgi:hypothetical protein
MHKLSAGDPGESEEKGEEDMIEKEDRRKWSPIVE